MNTGRGTLEGCLNRASLLGWLTVSGLLLRLVLLFALRHNPVFLDERDYEGLAGNLLAWHVLGVGAMPSAYRPPGEPLLIAAVYGIAGHHILLVKLVQELLLCLLPYLCARLARLLGMAVWQANLAALLIALHPALAYAATTVYPTAVTAVLLTAGIVYGTIAAQQGSERAAAVSGASLGLAGLFTTTFTPMAFLIGLYLAWKRKFRVALVLGVLGTLPAVAWVVRNRLEMGALVLATNGGFNLYLGANDEATPMSGNWVNPPPMKQTSELVKDRELEDEAKLWIRAHPARWAELGAARALLIVDSVGKPLTRGAHTGLAARLVAWSMLPVVLLGFAGLILYWRTPAAWFSAFALGLVMVSSAATIAKPRFRFPCDPLLATFAAGALGPGRRKAGQRSGDAARDGFGGDESGPRRVADA